MQMYCTFRYNVNPTGTQIFGNFIHCYFSVVKL
jgi:hypothetical protein